ncbi:rod shape-determining protein MreC, partial [Pseudomonas aeruginosa]
LDVGGVGTGHPERPEFRYVGDTADSKEGELLVRSGLGHRLPAGHPGDAVKDGIPDAREPVAVERALPTAKMSRS